jgi:hypothetical protein
MSTELIKQLQSEIAYWIVRIKLENDWNTIVKIETHIMALEHEIGRLAPHRG